MGNLKHYPLQSFSDLDPLIDAIGDRRIVMLGEASHGTHEYYTWRTAISKRLIKEKGYNFIAVEGDWPPCYEVNKYIKAHSQKAETAVEAVRAFDRWPSWMWANWETAALADWLHIFNINKGNNSKIGFYGLDVYSLWESLNEVIEYLIRNDGVAVQNAKEAFECFEPFNKDPQEYARSTGGMVPGNCKEEVVEMLKSVRINSQQQQETDDNEKEFSNEQNALVTVNAERYYRTMIKGGGASWNVRDEHMMETLRRLLDFHGPDSKAIVWEHNTHIGDARATDMANSRMHNIGQLAREEYGEEKVYLIGFGSHKGSVIAGHYWGDKMKKMEMPPARDGSWEHLLHREIGENAVLFNNDLFKLEYMYDQWPHRAIGVVYYPEREGYGNYVPSIIPERYDAFVYLDKTKALHPLYLHPDADSPPDLWPFEV